MHVLVAVPYGSDCCARPHMRLGVVEYVSSTTEAEALALAFMDLRGCDANVGDVWSMELHIPETLLEEFPRFCTWEEIAYELEKQDYDWLPDVSSEETWV